MARIKVTDLNFDTGILMICHPELPDLAIRPQDFVGEPVTVQVWKDSPLVIVASPGINDWFSQAIGQPARLVKLSHPLARPRQKMNPRKLAIRS